MLSLQNWERRVIMDRKAKLVSLEILEGPRKGDQIKVRPAEVLPYTRNNASIVLQLGHHVRSLHGSVECPPSSFC